MKKKENSIRTRRGKTTRRIDNRSEKKEARSKAKR